MMIANFHLYRLLNVQKYVNCCVALSDDLHLLLEYDALGAPNNSYPGTDADGK